MQCNVFKHFHLYQSTVKSMSFSTLVVNQALLAVSFVPWTLWFLLILNVFLKQDRTNLQNYPWNCAESIQHLVLVEEDIYFGFWDTWTPASSKQDLRHHWETTRWFFFFFCWKEMFLHKKHCMYCPRCHHFYKSEFRFHSLLAHFIICIFLLYRLNIFYVNSWLFFLVNSIEAPTTDDELTVPPCLRIFCGLNAYFLSQNWSSHCISQYTD